MSKNENSCNVKDYTLCILATLIIGGFFGTNALVFLIPHDPNNVVITTILNYTNSLAMLAAGYYFGASKSGDEKAKGTATTATVTPEGTTTLRTEPAPPTDPVTSGQTPQKG